MFAVSRRIMTTGANSAIRAGRGGCAALFQAGRELGGRRKRTARWQRPLAVTRSNKSWKIVDAWVRAAQASGFPYNEDYNGTSQEGVSYFQLTARNGLRCSAAKAYLKPARNRPNLTVITGFLTSNIVFEGSRAVGVAGYRDGGQAEIRARCEVVLSAGAIGSPQILMLSGVGDSAELSRHGIETRANAPGVGKTSRTICRPGPSTNAPRRPSTPEPAGC